MFMHAQAEAMTLDKLALMVQAGFLDMGDRFERVEGRLISVEDRLSGVEERLTSVEVDLTDVVNRLTGVESKLSNFATVNMHQQLTGRVCVIEGHLKI